jgi:MFS transporter
VARRDDKEPRKRFTKSGHTTHHPRTPPAQPGYGSQPTQQHPPPQRPPGYETARYAHNQSTEHIPPQRPGNYDSPTYHHVHGPGAQPGAPGADPTAVMPGTPPKNTVTRAVVSRSNELARNVTRKVINASKADGAEESGLTAMIWNQVLANGTDAMIAVALASTVFFGASTDAQKGNILLYLLVTMAPFAIVAPIIGPALDRLQHGRRWAMAGTAFGRAVLAGIMAGHPKDLLVLYPCALGSLVLSKAYSVIRASAAPKLVPPGMTLVEANSRLQIFSLAAGLIGGGFIGIVIKITGDSYSTGLWVTAVAFCICGYFAIRLPKQIDTVSSAPPPRTQRSGSEPRLGILRRMQAWAKRGFAAAVITSLQGEAMLRFLAGFLTIFLVFHIEATSHGWEAAAALGGIVLGSGAGSFIGTGLGTRLKLAHPERVVLLCAAVAVVTCVVTAILFSIPIAIMCMVISSTTNGLGKMSLDAVIQRDIIESLRASAFARSETFLQLAWVFGAAVGVLLPSENGSLGFWVAAAVLAAGCALIVMRNRAMKRAAAAPRPLPPGNVAPGHPQG